MDSICSLRRWRLAVGQPWFSRLAIETINKSDKET